MTPLGGRKRRYQEYSCDFGEVWEAVLSAGQDVLLDELRVLVAQRDAGTLSPEEFERRAAQLLKDPSAARVRPTPRPPAGEPEGPGPTASRPRGGGFSAAPAPGSSPAPDVPIVPSVGPQRWAAEPKAAAAPGATDGPPASVDRHAVPPAPPRAATSGPFSAAPSGSVAAEPQSTSASGVFSAVPVSSRTASSAAPAPAFTAAPETPPASSPGGALPSGSFSAAPTTQVAPVVTETIVEKVTEKRRRVRFSKRGRHSTSARSRSEAIPPAIPHDDLPGTSSLWEAAPAPSMWEAAPVAPPVETEPSVDDLGEAALAAPLERLAPPVESLWEAAPLAAEPVEAETAEPVQGETAEPSPVEPVPAESAVAAPEDEPTGEILVEALAAAEDPPALADLDVPEPTGLDLPPADGSPELDDDTAVTPVAPLDDEADIALMAEAVLYLPADEAHEEIVPAAPAASAAPRAERQRGLVAGSYWDLSERILPPDAPCGDGASVPAASMEGTYWDLSRRILAEADRRIEDDDPAGAQPGGYWDRSTIQR